MAFKMKILKKISLSAISKASLYLKYKNVSMYANMKYSVFQLFNDAINNIAQK